MPLPVGAHPDHGCHHELHTADGTVLHTCAQHWMEPIAAVAPVNELPEPAEPPVDLIVAIEQKLRAEAAARRAKRRNRQAGGAS